MRELLPRIAAARPTWDVAGVHAFAGPDRINRIPFFGDLVAAVLLWWRSRDADVVVVNGGEYAWPRMLARRTRSRTVCVWHGTRAGEIPALVARMTIPVRIYRALEVALQRIALAAHRHIAVSVTTVDELRTTYATRREIRVIANGRPRQASIETADSPGSGGPRLAWIGTNVYKKGFDIAFEACAAARAAVPDLRLVAIGIAAPSTGAPPWLECTGLIDHREAIRHLRSCVALVGSSRYEGCSVAIAEALALGIPILAGPTVAWMIGDAGIVAERLHVDDFARIITSFLTTPGAASRMSEAASVRARSFDWDDAASAYETEIAACL